MFKKLLSNKIFLVYILCAISFTGFSQEIDIRSRNLSITDGLTTYSENNNTHFGKQQGSSGTVVKTFVIYNNGYSNLTISGSSPYVSISGANAGDFSVSQAPSNTILPGESTEFTITFNPSSTGNRDAVITILNNDANEGTYNFNIRGEGIAGRVVRWVSNSGGTRPSTVLLNGSTYSTASITYTSIVSALNAAGTNDIVMLKDGIYRNPNATTSTGCSLFGTSQDTGLYINVNKTNLIITSETGDFSTSSARLVGYGINLIKEFSSDITIQGLTIDSARVNAIWNSNTVWGPTKNVKILKNKIINTYGHGIKTDGALQSSYDRGYWEVNGNHFENIGFYKYSACNYVAVSAIWLASGGPSFEVIGNTIKNTKWAGVLFQGFGSTSSNNTAGGINVLNNKIEKTVDAGIQIGFPNPDYYFPTNALIQGNVLSEINTSNKVGIAAITMLFSDLRQVRIIGNHVSNSFNGLAIDIAGWRNSADTTFVRYNNFCGLSGGFAVTHIAGISPNGTFGTGDDLAKYKFDNNYWGDPSGPTYASTNPLGTGEKLRKDINSLGSGTYSLNDYDYLTPFSSKPNSIALAGSCLCPPEANITGNSTNISDGDASPSLLDSTDFGIAISTIIRTFKIENLGNSAMIIDSTTITGTNASDFTILSSPTTVPKDSTYDIIIKFDASSLGLKGALLSVYNNDCDEAIYNFNIQGTWAAVSCDFSNTPASTIGTHSSTKSSITAGGWTCYCNASDEFLLALKIGTSGAIVPANAVQLKIDSKTPNYYTQNTGFVGNALGWVGLARTWDVAATTQPTSSVPVRLAFSQSDVDSINKTLSNNALTVINNEKDLSFYKVTNASKPAHATVASLSETDVAVYLYGTPSLTEWKDSSLGGGWFLAEMHVSSFSGGGGGAGPGGVTPLPVDLVNFSAFSVENKYITIQWTTAQEINANLFEIQKSTDGIVFRTLGTVKAQGNSQTLNNYSFDDFEVKEGNVYFYRLVSEDYDGSKSMSNITNAEILKMHSKDGIKVYPNPAVNKVQIDSKLGAFNLKVISTDGRVVMEEECLEEKLNLNIEHLEAGFYMLSILQNGIVTNFKLFIE